MTAVALPPQRRAKLTKKFYLQIPSGLYLVSNICWTPYSPVFGEKVVKDADREKQWKRIVDCGAAQKMCHIFANQKEHKNWVKKALSQANV